MAQLTPDDGSVFQDVKADRGEHRESKRGRVMRELHPGARVVVVRRAIDVGHPIDPKTGKPTTVWLNRVALWRQPSPEVKQVQSDWTHRHDKPEWRDRFRALRGPNLEAGAGALVVSTLPAVDNGRGGTMPWVMLLADSGEMGWCYAIDSLKVVEAEP